MPATWTRCALLLLIAVAAYFQTWAELWALWETAGASYTHGLPTAAVSLWLVWRTRTALNAIPAATDRRALPLVLLLSLIWLLVARASMLVAQSMLWPVLAFAILWAGAGWQAARKLAFPLAFLYFAIPFWDYFEPALHFVASHVVSLLFRVTGTQAAVVGSYILLPQATILIALACSGAHFLAISLAMGVLAGEMRGDPPRMRLLIMALAGLLGVASNAIRILLIVLAYLHPGLRAGLEAIGHLTFGWWVFTFDIVVFFLVLRLVPLSNKSDSRSAASAPVPAPAGNRSGFAVVIATATLLPLLAIATPRVGRYPNPIPNAVGISGTTGPLAPDSRWKPQFNGAAWAHHAAYLLPNGRVIELYRNEYRKQSEGKELFASHADLFQHEAFSVQTTTAALLQRPNQATLEVWRAQLRDQSGRDWSALYTYVIDGLAERDSRRVRLLIAARSLYSHPVAGVFAVATPCVPNCSAVAADLEQFAVHAYGAYESARTTP